MQDFVNPSCAYDEIPSLISGHEGQASIQTFNLRFSHKQFEVVDLIVQEPSLVKMQFNIPNPKNNLNAFLYEKEDIRAMTETPKTDSSSVSNSLKEFQVFLKP